MLISSVQQQADAIFQANQAAAQKKQAAAAAAAAAAQPKPIMFDISITVPLKYTPGTDINIAAREFCDRHGLDPAATVPVRSRHRLNQMSCSTLSSSNRQIKQCFRIWW